jgi:hypothetical protein
VVVKGTFWKNINILSILAHIVGAQVDTYMEIHPDIALKFVPSIVSKLCDNKTREQDMIMVSYATKWDRLK